MAEDLCQEIWLKVHHEIRGLRAPEAIRSWLYRIASRACIDFARSSRAARPSDEELVEELAQAYDPMPEDAAINGSQVRMVWESLATMAPRQGIALYLKQVDGRSYDEIGSILNCSRETVESLLFRARQSFVRAYDRVQSSPAERCNMFQQVVAGIVDNEPTQMQKSAIHAHMQECKPCRLQLPEMAAAAKGYSMLPLLPLTKGIVLQAILGGTAVGTALVTPATTGGVIAGLSLKAKLAALFGVLAIGATGAATTNVINVPIVPDVGAIFSQDNGHEDDAQLVNGNGNGADAVQQGVTGASDTGTGLSDATGTNGNGSTGALGRRDAGPSGTSGNGGNTNNPGGSPAAPAAGGAPGTTGEGGSSPESGGSTGGGGDPENPLGTLLQDPIGELDDLTGGLVGDTLGLVDGTLEGLDDTIEGVAGLADDTLGNLGETVDDVLEPLDPLLDDLTGGVVDDTLDTLLPPSDSEEPGPVEGLIDGVDDTLDDLLPGEEEDDGLLGGVLNPLLPPSETPPPASTPAPAPTPKPCLLGLLC
jgi:RNA polymerase sigma factor (sigma-70 family)